MTREDAIRIIETVFQDEYVYKYYDSITHQALNMAIEALTHEIRTETHGVCLISKDDAICEVLVNDGIDNIVDRINALPSADAYTEQQVRDAFNSGYSCGMEQTKEAQSADAVQGEWKHTITWQPYCSNCEYVFGEDEEFSPFWKYCPMCGARMENTK